MPRLSNKVALVTGASKGIGAAIARALAAEGAAVVATYSSDPDGAAAVVRSIMESGGRAISVKADVTKNAEAVASVDAALREYGRLDVLVNNSGLFAPSPLADLTEELYRRLFDVNVLGLLLTTKAAAPHLGEGGSIINISSIASTLPQPGLSIYSATKGAVDAITGVLARELGERRIRVNAINPGYIMTEGTEAAGMTGSEAERSMIARTTLGRAGQPADVADVAVFLASDEARWVTGERLSVSGGFG